MSESICPDFESLREISEDRLPSPATDALLLAIERAVVSTTRSGLVRVFVSAGTTSITRSINVDYAEEVVRNLARDPSVNEVYVNSRVVYKRPVASDGLDEKALREALA